MYKAIAALSCMLLGSNIAFAQIEDNQNQVQDSLYINEIEEKKLPEKVLHAEPLFIDLIRDLGARKGEHEWNFGMGITDNNKYDTYQALVEYEFAPIDRLGLEIEIPFTFYAPLGETTKNEMPAHRVESIKTAIQWSFFVSQKISTSMALGYINELEFHSLNQVSGKKLFSGNVFNPFLVVAKRWGNNFHSLIYTGPKFEQPFGDYAMKSAYDINTSFHYMIPGTRNFMGVEVNKEFHGHDFDMVIRPQLRLGIADNLLIGIVAGIPVGRETQRFSSFIRLIWEPGTAHRH
jgi:hypothetical protein